MIQYAVSIGRPDWSRFWDEISDYDYRMILALRRFQAVGHEREDWRSAVVALVMSGEASNMTRSEQLQAIYAMIQHRDTEDDTITGKQARDIIRRARGDVR